MNPYILIDLDWSNAAFCQHRTHFLSVECAANGCLETAFKFLVVLVLAHLLAKIKKFGLGNDAALRGLQDHVEPLGIVLSVLIEPPELVLALRCSDEGCPAVSISKHRSNNFVPDLWLHVGELIEDDTIKVRSTQGVGIISSVQADHRPVDEINTKFGFIRRFRQ